METTLGMGPTAVIPGTPYYTTNGQDATGCEVVGNWSDDRLDTRATCCLIMEYKFERVVA